MAERAKMHHDKCCACHTPLLLADVWRAEAAPEMADVDRLAARSAWLVICSKHE